MPEKISIVIPVYNCSVDLKECIQAIKLSTFENYEIIIVDDNSSDNIASINVEAKIKILYNKKNEGQSYSRNKGIKAADGGIILLLDADIIIFPDTLMNIAEFFQSNKEIGVLQGMYNEESYYKNIFSEYKNLNLVFREYIRKDIFVSFINTSVVAFKKDIIKKFSFDTNIRRAEDSLLGWRLYKEGYKIYLDKSLKVTHKKKLTFISFSVYQFKSGRDLLYNWIYKDMGSIILDKKTNFFVKIRIFIAPLSCLICLTFMLFLLLNIAILKFIIFFEIVLSIFLQLRFLIYLIKLKKPFIFLAALPLFIYDGLITSIGIGAGLLKILYKNKK